MLLTITMTSLYTEFSPVAVIRNRFLQGNTATFLSESFTFSDKIHRFWRTEPETTREWDTDTTRDAVVITSESNDGINVITKSHVLKENAMKTTNTGKDMAIGTIIHCWWEYKIVPLLWETV
jgi:hypothetical protein